MVYDRPMAEAIEFDTSRHETPVGELATKADLAALKAELIKWVVGGANPFPVRLSKEG